MTRQLLGMVRGITTGGSSVFYYATCFPIPFEMLKRHGIDLTAEAEEIRKELPVAPLKEEMIGPMSRRIRESAQDLGYNWRRLDKFMYQDRWESGFPFWSLWGSFRCEMERQKIYRRGPHSWCES